MAKRDFEFNKRNRSADVWSECTTDFVLPDFNGDVRRVLLFTATAYPSSAFLDGDNLECSGSVRFNLIYVNFEGEIESADFDSEYSFKIKCNAESYVDSVVNTAVSAQTLRLLSPRKISAKAALESTVDIISRDYFECSGTALEEVFDPQVKENVVKINYVRVGESVEREFSEVIASFDDKTVDEVRVLHAIAEAKVDDVSVDNGVASVKGSIKATALIKTDDMTIFKAEHVFRIDESMTSELSANGEDVSAKISISSVSAAVNGNEMGAEVLMNVLCEIRLLEEGNSAETVALDCYLCSCAVENGYDGFSYNEYLGNLGESWDYRERCDIEVEGTVRDVAFTSVIPKLDSSELSENALKLSGEIKALAIGCVTKDDGDVEYIGLKFNTKFEKNVNISCQNPDKTKAFVRLTANDANCEIDSDSIYLTANMCADVALYEERSLMCLAHSDAKEDKPFEKNPSRITVYYPEEGDTLYDIAKEFHTTTERILLNNSLSTSASVTEGEPALSGVKKLIIT